LPGAVKVGPLFTTAMWTVLNGTNKNRIILPYFWLACQDWDKYCCLQEKVSAITNNIKRWMEGWKRWKRAQVKKRNICHDSNCDRWMGR